MASHPHHEAESGHAQLPTGQASVSHHPPPPHPHQRRRFQRRAYGITSLPPEQADAKRLLALNRGHWTIENGNHRYRDTTFAEDASLMHTRHGPSNNAILNNIALAVIFQRGSNNVAAAVQEFAMDRSQAIRALTEPT